MATPLPSDLIERAQVKAARTVEKTVSTQIPSAADVCHKQITSAEFAKYTAQLQKSIVKWAKLLIASLTDKIMAAGSVKTSVEVMVVYDETTPDSVFTTAAEIVVAEFKRRLYSAEIISRTKLGLTICVSWTDLRNKLASGNAYKALAPAV
jgi:hypothetical protein